MQEAINQFINELKSTEEAADFYAARKSFEQDDVARDLMTRLNTMTYELSRKQHEGRLEENELALYRDVQKEFRTNDTVASLEQCENIFTDLLRECNSAISEEIKMDFAAQVAPAQCGCG
ncbi:MAG: YlbF family regulator [Balneolia bacterium]|nr:YlbF family regulator [Balneolia bacterium]